MIAGRIAVAKMACCNAVVLGESYTYIFAEREEEYLIIERIPCSREGGTDEEERLESSTPVEERTSRKMRLMNEYICDSGHSGERQDVTTEMVIILS